MDTKLRPNRIAASALVTLLALSILPAPLAPASAANEDGLVQCTQFYQEKTGIFDEIRAAGVPYKSPCDTFYDGAAPINGIYAGLQLDENEDRMGDEWQEAMDAVNLVAGIDSDGDGLTNLEEFWWLTNPLDADTDDDGWMDGDEADYWSQYGAKKGGTVKIGSTQYAYSAPLAALDTDGDHIPNMLDSDSDDDGLLDGSELGLGAKPELQDTDGDGLIDGGITPALAQRILGEVFDVGSLPNRADSDNDGLTDRDEYEHWTTVRGYENTKTLDTDGDGVTNILDPDSDGDGATDGAEVRANTRADDPDTDGDFLPDGWELAYNQQPTVNDASRDTDADGASNLEEYCYGLTLYACRNWNYAATQDYYRGGTYPNDADTEDDLVLDGDEFDAGTNPHFWDTDLDGMPDEFELQYNLDPLDATDAAKDADQDWFDQNQDGNPEQTHTNLEEYQYGRPASWDETSTMPWQGGTSPRDTDSDDDGANDAQEVYYGTDPRIPADLDSDDDQDGLNWTTEARLGTDPNDADTDGDGLCDGGRAPACTFPGLPGIGHPGEQDYGSTPWATDSDEDGIPDGVEATIWDPSASGADADVDADGVGGINDADNDGDDLLDGLEAAWGTRIDVPDSDTDGLLDGAEVFLYGTTPTDEDTDADGLLDGAEVQIHFTDPLNGDTDADGLTDGAEVQTHGTNPLATDSDADGLPDLWEVTEGTQPVVADADVDADGDGLNNLVEYQYGSSPIQTDTDLDTLPDGWEYEYDLSPRTPSQNIDSDSDGSLNGDEYIAGTNPRNPDTDADGLSDGDEAREGTLPLVVDSDADGLLDGEEVHTYGTEPLQRDTDADGLSDYDEVESTKTNPLDSDTDNDGLSDYEEVFLYQGIYDPNNPDTDGDGQSDGVEVALSDPEGDFDNDGLRNAQEEDTYGTDPTAADSDCDGIQDGAEVSYWQTRYGLTTYRAYLWNADVDGDGIKDGIEAGYAGTPQQALYRTEPDMRDTDGDGLDDDDEAQNNVKVSCSQAQTRSSARLPEPVPGFSLTGALGDASSLVSGFLYEDPSGVFFGVDGEGVYIQGAYGVRLYVLGQSVESGQLLGPWAMPAAAGTNGRQTDPQEWDTDGDGISDGAELNVYGTNPLLCDTDNDGLGDGLEVGMSGRTQRVEDACTHRDAQSSTTTDPLDRDSDDDTLLDGQEDANANGRLDTVLDAIGYCGRGGSETDARDMDTDDDGIPDLDEIEGVLSGAKPTSAFCFDTDGDGLSDGLEIGLKSSQKTVDTSTTNSVNVYGRIVKTWQPSATGLQLNPTVFDFDSDGIPDGLEDLNANGVWGPGEGEMDPSKADTDGDKIVDGRELLLYGLGNYQVPFAAVMEAWGGSMSRIQYDPSNLFQTDPLDSNTDNDDAIDGYDLNPVDDALLAIDFGTFKLRQRPDQSCGGWWCGGYDDGWTAEIYAELGLTLPTGTGGYLVSMSEDQWVPVWTKDARGLPGDLMNVITDESHDDTKPPGVLEAPMWRLAGAGTTVLLVDLPDNGVKLDKANQEITLDLMLRDKDVNDNDDIDLNPKNGNSKLQHTIPLGRPLSGDIDSTYPHLVVEEVYRDHVSKDDKAGNNKNGHLKLRMGDNVHEFFLRTVNDVLTLGNAQLPSGTCFANESCV